MSPRSLRLLALVLPTAACDPDNKINVNNVPPTAAITSPEDGGTVVEGDTVLLSGTVGDREDPMESLLADWIVGSSTVCAGVVPDASGLVSCETTIDAAATVTLRVKDSASAVGEDSVSVQVTPNEPPTVALVTPDAALPYYVDLPTGFELTVSDDLDDPSALTVTWTDNDTPMSLGGAPDSTGAWTGSASLTAGTHVLKATVTDTGGKTASASATITVYEENTVPECGFVAPEAASCFETDDTIVFEGTARDGETAPDRLSVTLSSSRDGGLSDTLVPTTTGTWTHAADGLSAGTHTVTLTVEDDYGDRCVETRTVEVADTVWYRDQDEDGYGDPATSIVSCEAPEGYVASATDCDDRDAFTHPGAARFESATDCMTDADGDGYGASPVVAGAVAGTDCNDTDSAISPDAAEVCDSVDNDCDGTVDDGVTTTFYADTDSDGYGDASVSQAACSLPSGYATNATDCDDSAASVNPGATEVCDAADVDEDCSGAADDADSGVDPSTYSTFYADADSDGYGNPSSTTASCDVLSGHVADNTDCDDSAASVNPGATEVCDSADFDEDCSGAADDADSGVDSSTFSTWYADTDTDGYGDAGSTTAACDVPSGYVTDDSDCDDSAATVNPGATEVCDSADMDEDCSGAADDADSGVDSFTFSTWYADADSDGEGDLGVSTASCDAPSGYVDNSTDCDDTDATVGLTATEVCDGQDNDCDGLSDDADADLDLSTATTWYEDADADGYGDASVSARRVWPPVATCRTTPTATTPSSTPTRALPSCATASRTTAATRRGPTTLAWCRGRPRQACGRMRRAPGPRASPRFRPISRCRPPVRPMCVKAPGTWSWRRRPTWMWWAKRAPRASFSLGATTPPSWPLRPMPSPWDSRDSPSPMVWEPTTRPRVGRRAVPVCIAMPTRTSNSRTWSSRRTRRTTVPHSTRPTAMCWPPV